MGGTWRRRGQTWQDGEWRRLWTAGVDLGGRAQMAFARMREMHAANIVKPDSDQHSCARTPAPFTGDGNPAGAPFIVQPEYRGFE
jgi:hypothetical protein